MVWDFAECNPISGVLDISSTVNWVASAVGSLPAQQPGFAEQHDACQPLKYNSAIVATDPPYYDNIGYADLADFFYVWLRRTLADIYPSLFSTLLVPKAQELVASPYRFGGDKMKARSFLKKV